MDITTRLTKDIAELASRLRKFYDFYYSLVEAKQIHLNLSPNYIMPESVDVYRITKDEYERWKKVEKIIDDFEVPF